MKWLLDTHLLLWAAAQPDRLSSEARVLLEAEDSELVFSVVSLWEIIIKQGLGREDFRVNARLLRRNLLDNGYRELSIDSRHVIALADLPALHKDPFDRMLIAQAGAEGITLLTADALVAQYPGEIRRV
ncbi:MAG: type II toxin-antitoxin system VapC family toxin [Sterolibacterium sp.]|jgi:PIN domain nuclease of toxin-antitoxin system|nr:type II toxin-antitoxin system VapC family toxin [Sterolibacterium sp.]